MTVSQDFLEYVIEQLAPAGRATSRRMFGGVGLYLDGLFFALIDDDVLYFKVGDTNRADYEMAGSKPFRPFADQPDYVMAYWQVPAEVLEDPEVLTRWARRSLEVALTARARTGARRRRPRR